jgi:hypothetical protein
MTRQAGTDPGADIACGAVAGVLATLVMSLVIAAGWLAGLFRTPPPKQITAAAHLKARVAPPKDWSTFQASWLGAHILYGVGCGVIFALTRLGLPALPGKPTGLGFGLGVWGVSYLGLMPMLQLYPWPGKDTPGRVATMIAAHVVFGVSLAEIHDRLRRWWHDGTSPASA